MLPKRLIGHAIVYSLNQYEKLTAFRSDVRLVIGNNRSKRSIKPFVIGGKNWLIANKPYGAKASATIYSVNETAKENGLHPYCYLKHLFEQLPQLPGPLDAETLEPFLPWSAKLPDHCRMKKYLQHSRFLLPPLDGGYSTFTNLIGDVSCPSA